ncbi:MAG: diaminohydroxyphosphoribosylaminopyrimidine deaminase [Marinoscillum sp.]|jgi:diaminohydroxyphosphoribosylaminopyrimidine deaminase/5-amino-6-(5-phosphoribosylamino)uracil reductase
MMINWEAVVKIYNELKTVETLPKFISIRMFESSVEIAFEDIGNKEAEVIIRLKDKGSDLLNPLEDHFFDIETKEGIDEQELDILRFYLPFAFCGYFGRKNQKCFSISHFAQTLDGKIATSIGDSKWIGNEENLVHAHRMRALCDGIVVGARTLERDNPKLNVRKVSGSDPIKIILGGNRLLDSEKYHALDSSTIVFQKSIDKSSKYDCVLMPETSVFDLSDILKILVKKGVYSIYIEGGSYTTSCFLEQRALDQVQIHFSSKILGSGVTAFSFGNIQEIKESINFQSVRFKPMGNEMMFLGNL